MHDVNNDALVFICWAGKTAKKCTEFLYNLILNKIGDNNKNKIFYSEKTLGEIHINTFQALNSAKIGIILIERFSINKPWLLFEVGALYNNSNGCTIIPVFINISQNEIVNSPLKNFQSQYYFNYRNVQSIIKIICTKLEISVSEDLERNTEDEKKEFEKFVSDNIIRDELLDLLSERGTSIYNNSESGFLAEIDKETFMRARPIIVRNAENDLIIAGPSLDVALGRQGNESDSLIDELRNTILHKKISKLGIVICDPCLFVDLSTHSQPLNKLSSTLENLKRNIFNYIDITSNVQINIYFIPFLDIDHVLINSKYMLLRNTKLWDPDENYKGIYSVHNKSSLEYKAHKNYLELLFSNATVIDSKIDTQIYDSDDTATQMMKNWRREVFSLGLNNIHLYKLYNSQILSYMSDDWMNGINNQIRFVPSEVIKKYEDLFVARNLLSDDTQNILLPYIEKTQKEFFEPVIKKYDPSIINNTNHGFVKIFPSLDLGCSNNVQRLAGGFATGMLVTWHCGTPIIPVDATVNVCSSSVFKLKDKEKILGWTEKQFLKKIDTLITEATKEEYSFSFDKGNHFLMIAIDDKSGDVYLVLHSSAKEFKDSYMGLYPTEYNWYSDRIRVYPEPRTSGRYFRYIKDEDARYFYFISKHLENCNKNIHEWFANQLTWEKDDNTQTTFHHYYMPNESAIAIGTFVVKPGTTVPIFSNVGKSICMFRVSDRRGDNWKVVLKGEEYCLVPHGWGQKFIDIYDSPIVWENTLKLGDRSYNISSKERINQSQKKIREFKDCQEFLNRGNKFLKGEITQILKPIFLYCQDFKGKISDE